MRVIQINNGVCELCWMWLPTFIAQNRALMQRLQKEMAEKFTGREMTDNVLDEIHAWTIEWLDKVHHISGLKNYLSAISAVEEA